ncbi:MAG: GNAT family N-acetyltransferase, partial [Candidatus Jordarchaeaceae archaeon]
SNHAIHHESQWMHRKFIDFTLLNISVVIGGSKDLYELKSGLGTAITMNQNQIELRTLSIKDYDAILNLWKQADLPFKPKGRESKEAMKVHIEHEPDLFIGAFHKDKLVGVVIGSHDYRKGWINRLAVHPQYRRHGIGQLLISSVEKALQRKGIKIFATLIEKDNVASLNLFKKAGYKVENSILYLTKRENLDV